MGTYLDVSMYTALYHVLGIYQHSSGTKETFPGLQIQYTLKSKEGNFFLLKQVQMPYHFEAHSQTEKTHILRLLNKIVIQEISKLI